MVYWQAFANDIFPLDTVTTQGPCPLRVQTAVHLVETWSDEWVVTFNMSKCQFIDIITTRAVTPLWCSSTVRRCPKSLSSSTWACGLTPNCDGITSKSFVAFVSTSSRTYASCELDTGAYTLRVVFVLM